MEMSPDERGQLLTLYKGLRVADVRDGMDWNMLHGQGSMSVEIRPLYRVRTYGIARTVRYVPYTGSIPSMSPEEYTAWSGWYYEQVCSYPWIAEIQPGDFVVIDQGGVDAGLMGSNNSLEGVRRGAAGYVTNGGMRDTDELILEKIPFWSRFISQSMVQGRLQYDARDISIEVGGVIVNSGDIVVADGDGVIVVPRGKAREVAQYAHQEWSGDKVARRRLYDQMGIEPDDSLR